MKQILKNPLCLCLIFYWMGYLSLSFLGIENKSLRIVSLGLIYLILIFFRTKHTKDPIYKNIILFCAFCFPSLIFADEPYACIFKLFELCTMPVVILLGYRHFKIDKKENVTDFLMKYYVFQTLFSLIGYYVDPTTRAIDNGYGTYVTFLSCHYPPIHAYSRGPFCAISAIYSFYKWHEKYFSKEIVKGILWAIICCLSLYTMYLTSSRTGMIAWLNAMLFLVYRMFSIKKKIMYLIFAIALLIPFYETISDFATAVIMKKQNDELLSKSDNITNQMTSGRISLWKRALSSPQACILGKGYGIATKAMSDKIGAANAHNSIVELLLNVGLPATFCWIYLWFLLFKRYLLICKFKSMLPYHVNYYHMAASIALLSFVKSFGNVSFVYMQLDIWATLSVIILFIYTQGSIKNKLKKNQYKNNTSVTP